MPNVHSYCCFTSGESSASVVVQLFWKMAGFPPDLEMSRTLVAVLAAFVLLCICLAAQFESVDLLPLFAQGLVHAAQVVAHHA